MNVIDDATLLKMAEAEILGEAKRAAARHSIAGVSGWQPCPKPNKVFLTNTILQTMSRNRIISKKKNERGDKVLKSKKRDRKLLQNSKTERTNFVYQKPRKNEGKVVTNTSSVSFKKNQNLRDSLSKKPEEISRKCLPKSIKLNKT